MSRLKEIKNIVIHCSAGFSGVTSIEDFWRNSLKWKSKGYHIIIDTDGTTYYLKDSTAKYGYSKNKSDLNLEFITNGVAKFNLKEIHICYIGGIEKVGTVFKGKDTRTDAQKKSIEEALKLVVELLKKAGKDVNSNLGVVGHRDYSKDSNNNGTIESWERIKECPSFEVIGSKLHYDYSSKDRYNKLPTK